MQNERVNDDSKFLIRRMDTLEFRVMEKIDHLMAFKNKALGIIAVVSVVGGGIGSLVIEILSKHLL